MESPIILNGLRAVMRSSRKGERFMALYKIAGLLVSMECNYEFTLQRSREYLLDAPETVTAEQVQIEIDIPREKIVEYTKTHPQLKEAQWEYMVTGSRFSRLLLDYDGIMLHSSAVVVDGDAFLFSADPGTGKSTHTSLWLRHFGERAFIINDDKPVIRRIDGEYRVFGTPWSGKTDQNVNTSARLAGIAFLERSEENWIRPADRKAAVPKFIRQTTRKMPEEYMEKMLAYADKLLGSVPLYEMGCNISEEAVMMAYEAMRREKERF